MSTSNTSGHLYEPHKSNLGGPRRRDTQDEIASTIRFPPRLDPFLAVNGQLDTIGIFHPATGKNGESGIGYQFLLLFEAVDNTNGYSDRPT